jgi:hypothetical protein
LQRAFLAGFDNGLLNVVAALGVEKSGYPVPQTAAVAVQNFLPAPAPAPAVKQSFEAYSAPELLISVQV